MDLGISGKRALVLGGSKGLGRGIAEALAAEGVAVALTGRNEETAAKAAAEIGRTLPAFRSTLQSLKSSTPSSIGSPPHSDRSIFWY